MYGQAKGRAFLRSKNPLFVHSINNSTFLFGFYPKVKTNYLLSMFTEFARFVWMFALNPAPLLVDIGKLINQFGKA